MKASKNGPPQAVIKHTDHGVQVIRRVEEGKVMADDSRFGIMFGRRRKRGEGSKYPWDIWFNGEEHILTQQEHFPGTLPKSFRKRALDAAKERGIVIETFLSGDKVGIHRIREQP